MASKAVLPAIVCVGILVAACFGELAIEKAEAEVNPPRPRFEMLMKEELGDTTWFEVFHDRESGVEFICHNHRHSASAVGMGESCVLTGRKW